MKRTSFLLLLAGISVVPATQAAAQTATQNVTYAVSAINQISMSGSPSLTVNSATAGSAPNSALSTGITWAITSNETNKKVTAGLDSAMVTGVTLKANLTAPTATGTSAGAVTLGTVAVDAVTGMSKPEQSGISLVYTLTATTAAGVVTSKTRTVTYTIAAGI